MKRGTENITANNVSIPSKEKKIGNEKNEKDNFQVNPYNKSEDNKSEGSNTSKQKEETMNAHHSYMIIYECGKKNRHLTY